MRYEIDHPEQFNSRRSRLGMSLTDVARMADIPVDRLINYEHGRQLTIDGPTLINLAEVLICEPSEFCSSYQDPEYHVTNVAINVELLNSFLAENHISGNEFARVAGVSPSLIYGFTRIGRRTCRAHSAMKIAKTMSVDPGRLSPALAMYPPLED